LIKSCQKLRKTSINRIWLTVDDAKGAALSDKRKKLQDYCPNDKHDLIYKDLGPQISWTTVFLVEYFGPILITAILSLFQKEIYGKSVPFTFTQKLGIVMVLIHYIKREFETLFVHRFSADTMPYTNIFKNSFHYWGIFGYFTMYFFLHPNYTPPSWASNGTHIVLFVSWLICEIMNLMCHITLRNLRKPGTSERGIPKGFGFDHVSSANYFWEFLCWTIFAIQS